MNSDIRHYRDGTLVYGDETYEEVQTITLEQRMHSLAVTQGESQSPPMSQTPSAPNYLSITRTDRCQSHGPKLPCGECWLEANPVEQTTSTHAWKDPTCSTCPPPRPYVYVDNDVSSEHTCPTCMHTTTIHAPMH